MQRSESINEIAAALAKAQANVKMAKKDSLNPHYKSQYADLAAIWDACREALSENAIAVSQVPEIDDGKMYIETLLMHSSGQWIVGRWPVRPVVDTPQGIGSSATYAKRYSLSSMVGVAPADEDDDGNEASKGKAVSNGNSKAKAGSQIAVPAEPKAEKVPASGVTQLKTDVRNLWTLVLRATDPEEMDALLAEYEPVISRCRTELPDWWEGVEGKEGLQAVIARMLKTVNSTTILSAG